MTDQQLRVVYNVELTQRVSDDFDSDDLTIAEFRGKPIPTVPVMHKTWVFHYPANVDRAVYESSETCHAAFKRALQSVRGTDADPGVFLHKGSVEVVRTSLVDKR